MINSYAWIGQFAAPLAIAAGVLICLWGYRILNITLGIVGFVAGATGGWAIGLALVPGNTGLAQGCALVLGLIGAVLCIWQHIFGVCLLGASAGAAVAAAVFSGLGHPVQPILVIAFAIVFGVLAFVLQRFMMIVSTSFNGSYLITAGILHLVLAATKVSPLWFDHVPSHSSAIWTRGALAFWLLVGLVGIGHQYRAYGKKAKAAPPVPQPA